MNFNHDIVGISSWRPRAAGPDTAAPCTRLNPNGLTRHNKILIVSRDTFERTKPDLKTFLTTVSGCGPDKEAFHASLRSVRFDTGWAFAWCRLSDED